MIACLLFSTSPINYAFAVEEPTTESLDSQKEELERNLAAANKKLAELGKKSKDTKEYLNALDDKIDYLNRQYYLAKDEVSTIESKVESLESNVEKNESSIAQIQVDIDSLQGEYDKLNANFQEVYQIYCNRIRAIYISGDQCSMLSFLLSSNSLSSLLTRYQMVSAISKSDGELLRSVKEQTDSILATKEQLSQKNIELTQTTREMTTNKASLENRRIELLQKQDDMQSKQADIEIQQTEANKLLKDLNDKSKEYGEYRDITQEELDAIDAAIEEAARKYRAKTTTTKKTTTTTAPADENQESTTTETTQEANSNYIRLTYPCPSYTRITCGFGAYSGHTGCDFSTGGNQNQSIVAAEDGVVILVRLLETSYGHYVVILHDKTTSSGSAVYTLYAHNNDIVVSEGQQVSKGQLIAYSGSTGNSTGPHCHFEVRVGGASQGYAVNPAIYLP